MGKMPIDKLMALTAAKFDQMKMCGVEWMRESDLMMLQAFIDTLNKGDAPDFREMGDAELMIMRNLAMIGLYEVSDIFMRQSKEAMDREKAGE